MSQLTLKLNYGPKINPAQRSMEWLRFVTQMSEPIGAVHGPDDLVHRRNPIANGEIPGYARLLRKGSLIARPRCDGLASQLRQHTIDGTDSLLAYEDQFAFGALQIPNSRFLVTYDLQSCLAIIAHNPDERAGFLAHATVTVSAFDAVERALTLLRPKTFFLYGGDGSNPNSVEMVRIAEALLSKNKATVIGRDTLRGKSRISSIPMFDSAIALDTLTGEVFIPSNMIPLSKSYIYQLRSAYPKLASQIKL